MVKDEVRDNAPRKMLSIDDVLELVPISASTLYRLEREGLFPEGRAVSAKGKAWFADEVAAWQRDLVGKKRRVRS